MLSCADGSSVAELARAGMDYGSGTYAIAFCYELCMRRSQLGDGETAGSKVLGLSSRTDQTQHIVTRACRSVDSEEMARPKQCAR